MEGQQVKVEPLTPAARVVIAQRIPCVVTCGALVRGLCMIWDPDEKYIESISFRYNDAGQ